MLPAVDAASAAFPAHRITTSGWIFLLAHRRVREKLHSTHAATAKPVMSPSDYSSPVSPAIYLQFHSFSSSNRQPRVSLIKKRLLLFSLKKDVN
jgi:hypothetical protein